MSKRQASDECWPLGDEWVWQKLMFWFEGVNTNLKAHIAYQYSNAAARPAISININIMKEDYHSSAWKI